MPGKALSPSKLFDHPVTAKKPLVTNPRLLEGGEANPLDYWTNLADYDYSCPREEYVQCSEPPDCITMSRKWNVPHGTLMQWKMQQRWDDLRAREWQGVAHRAWELSREAVAEVQARELVEQLRHWTMQRRALEASLRRGAVDEQSASGKRWERPLNIADRKAAAQTMQIIDGEIARVMGMSEAFKKIKAEEDQPRTARAVRRIRHNYTVTEEFEEPEMNELPIGDVIEAQSGEVLAGDLAERIP